ncbi:DUF1614 domain-containing protein [Sulfuracidifex metallicus]|uniref:DUF1614 domain-containing protein n=1 Tax=Sulfuracidifex metallicus DSM 6482 = JCM 9184 TaxID=523847 RepID=A0A6A9QNG7_SULME|nr:DUF1614 domain-containing protein [Sulfuracidifex metallicus]MUN28815.1 DUF1614 domain-containing protein [Sulfuracidifex metallicus DSM 6482 = JCM 9184]WOE50671.1 DUF1614 domain-containing protein [Sulfuracidifex metallicus DSM 6482 = JCM 9184]
MGDDKRIIFLIPFRGIASIVIHIFLGIFIAILATSYFAEIFSYLGLPIYLSYGLGIEIAFLSLLLSPINIVIKKVENNVFSIQQDVVYFFGIPIVVPRPFEQRMYTYIALNAGGAILPLITTLFLLFSLHALPLLLVIVETIMIILLSKSIAKVIPGVGVVMPPIIPSIISSFISYILFFSVNPILVPLSAYISSVLGTLIGADILNMKRMLQDARPQMISIGGMGTFDGIFISGLLSLAIGTFLISI